MIRVDVAQRIGKPIPIQFWRYWLARLVRECRLKPTYELSIAIVNGPTIKRLNRQYRSRDEVTDVLSFRDEDGPRTPTGTKRPAVQYLGELIICLPRAQEQAKTLGHDLSDELAVLFVHGCFHLLGYEHHHQAEADVMRKLEERVLGKIRLAGR